MTGREKPLAILRKWTWGDTRDADANAGCALRGLKAAGYRILAPGEVDEETLERAAAIISKSVTQADSEAVASRCHNLAAAIRALGGGEQ